MFGIIKTEIGKLILKHPQTLGVFKSMQEMKNTDCSKFRLFKATTDDEVREGMKRFNLSERSRLVTIGDLTGYAEGHLERLEYLNTCDEQIRLHCNPYEVYCYMYNQYECYLHNNDLKAYKFVLDLFGYDRIRKMRRMI